MTQIQSAFRRPHGDSSDKSLHALFTPTRDELLFVRRLTAARTSQVAVLIHLKMFQYLGYFTTLAEVPERIQRFIVARLDQRPLPSAGPLERYDKSGAKRKHFAKLRARLNVSPFDADRDTPWLTSVAETAALTKQKPEDIVSVMLEELVRLRFEIPGYSLLERTALAAQGRVHDRMLAELSAQVSAAARAQIDALLTRAAEASRTGWNDMKAEPKKPTSNNVRTVLARIQRLKKLADALPPLALSEHKLRFFFSHARSLDAFQLRRYTADKRYALATIYLRGRQAEAFDELATIFLRLMQRLENTARRLLEEHQLGATGVVDGLVAQLKAILEAYVIDGTDTQKVCAIDSSLMADVAALVAACDAHLAYADKNSLPFLREPYSRVRSLLFDCLELAGLQSARDDRGAAPLLPILLSLRKSRTDDLVPQEIGLHVPPDLNWLGALWRKLVIHRVPDRKDVLLQRRYLELAILFRVRDELKCGDLYVPHGAKYDDYRDELVDAKTLEVELPIYGEQTGLSIDPEEFTSKLRDTLVAKARAVDGRFADNEHAWLVDDRLVLTRITRDKPTPEQQKLDNAITEQLEETSILDVLLDATRWVKLHEEFRPLSGERARIPDQVQRAVASMFCYGCNLGPTQMQRSVKGLSRKQVAWFNLHHVDEESLDLAKNRIINAYNRYELIRFWGSGEHASADGTQWTMYLQNLYAEKHVRYGGWGGLGYYHNSDTYIALFSHFTTCGTHEAIHILDGLLQNTSDIRPTTVHGDTQAQSIPVFALAHLLGIKLMPRIRNISGLTFARPTAEDKYSNLEPLFDREPIKWDRIEKNLHEMMRIAVSIKLGKMTASSILRRLGVKSRDNPVYDGFYELGKVIRTLFLLDYIDDFDTRKMIHRETNKSEQLNGFLAWCFFGGDGTIAENQQHEQRKIIKYNHLVANLIILYNVNAMTRAIADLQRDGVELNAELLRGLAPYRTRHINRFGDYVLDLSRRMGPMHHAQSIRVPEVVAETLGTRANEQSAGGAADSLN